MRKRNAFTILEQAVTAVPEFETMLKKLSGQVTCTPGKKSRAFVPLPVICRLYCLLPVHDCN